MLIFNASGVSQLCNWTFVSVVDLQGAQAWAAVRSGWGGDDLREAVGDWDSVLTPRDTWVCGGC